MKTYRHLYIILIILLPPVTLQCMNDRVIEEHAVENTLLGRLLSSGADYDFIEIHHPVTENALAETTLDTIPNWVSEAYHSIPIWRTLETSVAGEAQSQRHPAWKQFVEKLNQKLVERHLLLAQHEWYQFVAHNALHEEPQQSKAMLQTVTCTQEVNEETPTAAIAHMAYSYQLCTRRQCSNAIPHLYKALELASANEALLKLLTFTIDIPILQDEK